MSVTAAPYVISENDKRGLVVVITATTLSFVWTCWSIRIWLRYNTREWRPDDYFLAAATVLDTIQSSLIFRVVDEGLGRSQESVTVQDLRQIGKHDLATQLLYVVTLLLSKYAVLSLYLRLSPQKGHAIATWTTIALSSVWAVTAVALIAAPCSSIQFWPEGSKGCSDLLTKWEAIGTFDIVTEVAIFLIAVYLVVGLHMGTRSKMLVVAAFSARLPVIAAAIARLVYLLQTLIAEDRTLASAYYVVSTQWQLGYAIMSCTITGLGPFLRPFSKSTTSYRHSSYAPNSSTHSGDHATAVSYQLSSLKAHKVSVTAYDINQLELTSRRCSIDAALPDSNVSASPAKSLKLRPDITAYGVDTACSGGNTMAGDDEDVASNASGESRRWIITKKTELRVETGRAKD
ncbi:hypothetical protein K491DRAFT_155473 [Lophiostoma macrostomum CBS 122681]|uniref:Rhodopsin domain-containing protein n=1 Tax=Lophiostoma macrostomum CBS 122681 TaxID=1314788 RepID=A0A6A6SRE8_9PLEO|nr:hypothetical protein K491DRAFT_155473 [Lophiostoma macrostomum CBS 122681]